MDTSIGQLKKIFKQSPLSDLVVTGYIDKGSSLSARNAPRQRFGQFHALWDEIYLEVGQTLLRFRAIDAYSRLHISQVERIECSFDIDPDDTFGLMSALRILLPSGRDSAQVERLDLFLEPEGLPEEAVAIALGLALDKDEYLFFDPQDAANGIHVGPAQSRDLWLLWKGAQYQLKSFPIETP